MQEKEKQDQTWARNQRNKRKNKRKKKKKPIKHTNEHVRFPQTFALLWDLRAMQTSKTRPDGYDEITIDRRAQVTAGVFSALGACRTIFYLKLTHKTSNGFLGVDLIAAHREIHWLEVTITSDSQRAVYYALCGTARGELYQTRIWVINVDLAPSPAT